MSRFSVRLDHEGIAAMLKSAEVREAVHTLAERAAAAVRADPSVVRHKAPVRVADYTTDRAASSVTIAHAGGRGMEAKHGSLSRGAAEVGLDVKGYPS